MGNLLVQHNFFGLNTVYYARKSEIRITVPADVVAAVTAYSLMVMQKPVGADAVDYELDIYLPGSPGYVQYIARCNKVMPSGGKLQPRRFGWL